MNRKYNLQPGNSRLLQKLNLNLVFDVIRNKSPISQAEVSRVTGLSCGTITNLIKILKKRNFIQEIGFGESSGGRKPVLLKLNPEATFIMSASFKADEIAVAILNLTCEIRKSCVVPTEVEKGEKRVFENFKRAADSLLGSLHLRKRDILGLGASFEGILDHKKGVLARSVRFGWQNVPVREILGKSYGLKTYVEGDARTIVLGEYHYGIGKGANSMVCVDIDSGIATAEIFNGRIYHGAFGMEGEIGHSLAAPNGPECRCGKRGCLEAVAGGQALISAVRNSGKLKNLNNKKMLAESVIARNIFRLAEEGDAFILKTIKRIGYHLGLAVANIINYTDPEMVILAGYMINESGDLLLNIVKETAFKHVICGESRKVRIERGVLGGKANLIGAATLVYQDLFNQPRVYA